MTLLSKSTHHNSLQKGLLTTTTRVIFVRSYSSTLLNSSHLMKRKVSQPPVDVPDLKRSKLTMATTKIKLTPREEQLRQILLDVAQSINESKILKEQLELRFAGGWVRDKVLGLQSHDIDVAINLMTGYPFCQEMRKYFEKDGNMEKHSLVPTDIGNLHQVLANPEKSKHLETATTRLIGYDLDFVNLRKETYTENSRNPLMEFGDAREDALRRDATINALFYNLHSDTVEDFTEGLKDLAAKRIRTPLNPKTTFTDDPLRVLRLIRFASRLDFKIDPECEAYMSDPAVMEALKLKISRERVGIEVTKMMKDKKPRTALQLIDHLGLYSAIFTDPTAKESPKPNTTNWHLAYDCLEELKNNETPGSIYHTFVRADEAKYLAWILVSFTPWAGIIEPVQKGKTKLLPGVIAAREGIKTDNKVTTLLQGSLKNYKDIIALKDAILCKIEYTTQRDIVGMMIRKWDLQGNWRLQTLFAILVEAMNNSAEGYLDLFGEWQSFIHHLEAMNIMNAPSEKPIVDGSKLLKALEVKKAGPWMAKALEFCMAWQLRNPGNEDIKEAVAELKEKRAELGIPT